MKKILIIEDNINWQKYLSNALGQDYKLYFCYDDETIIRRLHLENFNLVIFNIDFRPEDPFALLKKIKSALSNIPVIITSRTEKAELVVRCIKEGAFDFITKPYIAEKIFLSVEKAFKNRGLKGELDYLRHEQDIIYDFDRIVAASPIMKDTIKVLKKFSKTDATVLITGETGTGKSFLSGSVHFNSHRQKMPFVKINCSNIPENLLESELFGHEKGAFTGADKLRQGRFEQADGGTIFLDEIGELSLTLQGKLLRVLEEKSFERIGSNKTIHVDVRVIAASNRVLEEQIEKGNFREDLFYRINGLTVHLPPLRKRKECLEPLAYWILNKSNRSLKKKINGFSSDVIQLFRSFNWPGNIRQLANIIERAVILEEGPLIHKESLVLSETIKSTGNGKNNGFSDSLQDTEKNHIMQTLEKSLWIQKDAAKILGITPRALNYKIKNLKITHPRWRKNR